MQRWADALVDNFRSLGGELKVGSRVDKIITKDGAAVGVESCGEFPPADWVISAADIRLARNDPEFFRKVSIGLYSPSLHDPRLAPEGKSGLMIQAISPYHWMDNWAGAGKLKYRGLRGSVKQTLI